MKPIKVADLFCGCGGTSTGVAQYAESVGRKLDLVAVNHWDRAVETHAKNHPKANHFCQDLTRLKPGEAVPGGRLDLLVASPECTHHSNARGGKPKNDQSRASAWVVLEWVNALQVDRVLIENVPEFQSWGPIGSNGKALASKKGETFRAFIAALVASGYRVEYKTLNAADYGAATSRRRLFIQAVKGGRRRIVWPEPTHSKDQRDNLFGRLPKWRGAREIIDWNLLGTSIFTRSRPLSANTMARIEAGLKKFGGANAEPYIVQANHGADKGGGGHERRAQSINDPLGTIMAGGKSHAVVQPVVRRMPSFDEWYAKTKDLGGSREEYERICLDESRSRLEPFIAPYYGTGVPDSVGEPLATVSTKDRFGLVDPRSSNGEQVAIDILFRMLRPHELKAAMGFDPDYIITGNLGEQVKQIGNAVEVKQARALAGAAFSN